MRISPIYRSEFLLKDLVKRASSRDGDAFLNFQGNSLLQIMGNDLFDFMAVNTFYLRQNGTLDGGLTSSVFNAPKAVVESYERNILHDTFTPTLFAKTGTAVFNSAVKSMEEWEDSPIYTEHCSIFDFGVVCEVAYTFPFHRLPRIVIFMSKAPGAQFSAHLTEEEIEYIFFPFYLGWLRVFDLIDHETLDRWLQLLCGMSLARFRVLRSLFEPQPWNGKKRALELGVSDAAIYRHIEGAFEHLLTVDPELQNDNVSANRLVELTKAYYFFSFAPGEIKRSMPRKRV